MRSLCSGTASATRTGSPTWIRGTPMPDARLACCSDIVVCFALVPLPPIVQGGARGCRPDDPNCRILIHSSKTSSYFESDTSCKNSLISSIVLLLHTLLRNFGSGIFNGSDSEVPDPPCVLKLRKPPCLGRKLGPISLRTNQKRCHCHSGTNQNARIFKI